MINLLTFALIGILGIASSSYSQDIPDGVKNIMEQLQTDPKAEYGFDFAQKHHFIDKNDQFNDWFVGLPIEFYKLNGEALEQSKEGSEITDLIVTTNTWRIPVRINDHYLYHVLVFYDNGIYKSIGCGENVIGFKTWDKVRKKYPEETGVRPIVIGKKYKFLYFPHKKDGKSIFYVRNPKWNDPLSSTTSQSLDNLDENNKIVKYWKDEWKKNKEKRRKFYDKHPDIFKKKSGGEK